MPVVGSNLTDSTPSLVDTTSGAGSVTNATSSPVTQSSDKNHHSTNATDPVTSILPSLTLLTSTLSSITTPLLTTVATTTGRQPLYLLPAPLIHTSILFVKKQKIKMIFTINFIVCYLNFIIAKWPLF